MHHIDGSKYSGSGTLLRYAASLATLRKEPLHLYNIRTRRDKPGLRPQHLTALRACASLCSGTLRGDHVDSREIYYDPGKTIRGGEFVWNIGTAGSTAMLAFSLLPLALYAESPCRFTFFGGLFQDFAPTAFHMQKVLFPVLGRMGLDIRLEIIRPGYVPEGQGCLAMTVQPLSVPPRPVNLPEQGDITRIRGISLESHLEKEKVAERMAGRCREILENGGLKTTIDVHHDTTAVQKGAALLLWAETDSGCRLGADQAGRRGRRSEAIAEFVCRSLMEDLNTGASVDRHLADQLILFAALARGRSVYAIPMPTDHIQSNCWLIREMLGAESNLLENRLIIEGTGFSR